MQKESTDTLNKVLKNTEPEQIDDYLRTYADSLADGPHPFGDYMREMLRHKGMTQQALFDRAGLSQRYGYRLLTQETHTRQRDYILRLCFAASLSLQETQRALKLYGMSELYARIPRDAVLMIALNRGISEIPQVNRLLEEHGADPLKAVAAAE